MVQKAESVTHYVEDFNQNDNKLNKSFFPDAVACTN